MRRLVGGTDGGVEDGLFLVGSGSGGGVRRFCTAEERVVCKKERRERSGCYKL